MLIILGGLPGVGKSTIGKRLAEKLEAIYLRIDSIEQAIRDAAPKNEQGYSIIVAEGYMVACAIASDNLQLGHMVIADSVNPIEITRHDYRKVAESLGKPYLQIEIICSDKALHQHRVETRSVSVSNLKLPTWHEVLERDYEVWDKTDIIIDTANYSVDSAVEEIIRKIEEYA